MKNEGITGVDLAEKIGVSKQYISQILSGKQDLRVATLEKIAAALNVHPGSLLENGSEVIPLSSKSMTKKVIFQIEVDESVDDNYLKMVIGKEFMNQLKK